MAASANEQDYDGMRSKIMEASKKFFKPEFLNRLDDLIVFRMLEKPDLAKIVDLEIQKVTGRIAKKQISLVLNEAARDLLIEDGHDPQYGARPMRRAVERYLEDPFAEASTVFSKEVLRTGIPIAIESPALQQQFEMLTLADYARLNEERQAVLAS